MLTYIQFNWRSLKSDEALVAALKECAFVEREQPAADAASGGPAASASTVRPPSASSADR